MAQLLNTSLFGDANLVSYYKLEDTSDSKGANTLTNNNSVAFNAAKYGNGGDGGAANTNKYLSNATNLGIAGNGDVSISLWVKLNAEIGSGNWRLWELNSTTGADRYALCYYDFNGGTRRIVLDAAGGTAATYTVTLGTSAFYHVVCTRNVSGNQAKLYVNNVLQSTGTIGTGTTPGASNNFGLIASPTGVSPGSEILDDVGIFNRVLTAAEVAILFNDLTGTLTLNSKKW